jgi:hypothetical protein
VWGAVQATLRHEQATAPPPAVRRRTVAGCDRLQNANSHRYVNSALCLSQECDTAPLGGVGLASETDLCSTVACRQRDATSVQRTAERPVAGPPEIGAVDLERDPTALSAEEARVAIFDLDRFYSDVLHELGLLAQRGGSATGAAAVVKRVALAHGVAAADCVPLPRLNRAELDDFGRRGVSRERARRGQ